MQIGSQETAEISYKCLMIHFSKDVLLRQTDCQMIQMPQANQSSVWKGHVITLTGTLILPVDVEWVKSICVAADAQKLHFQSYK